MICQTTMMFTGILKLLLPKLMYWLILITFLFFRPKSTRKRKANQKDWKKNISKRLRQSGKEYKSCRGQAVRARALRRNCVNCRFKCLDNFSEKEAALFHNEFWTKTDDAKGHFYEKTTERYRVKRQRNRNVRQRTKSFSHKYFFIKNE